MTEGADKNAQRAEWAAIACDAYGIASEGKPDYDAPEDIAADLICNLLHLIRAHEADPMGKLKTAITNFVAEEREAETGEFSWGADSVEIIINKPAEEN